MLPHRFQRLWKIQLSNRIESSRVRVRNGSLFRGIISVIIRVNLGTQPLDVIHGIVTCGGFALLERLINAMQCNLDLARAYLPSRSWCPMHQSRAGGDQRCVDHRGTCCPGPAQQQQQQHRNRVQPPERHSMIRFDITHQSLRGARNETRDVEHSHRH